MKSEIHSAPQRRNTESEETVMYRLNEKYLKSFLEALLNEKIDEIEVMRRSKFVTNEKRRKIRKNRHKSNNK